MSDTTEQRKLEWACREIEFMLKRISMLENPIFWAGEMLRRRLAKEDVMAWARPVGTTRVGDGTGSAPNIHTWWIPPSEPDLTQTWFAIARCCTPFKAYGEVMFFNGISTIGDEAQALVKEKLIDRLVNEGVLTTACNHDNPLGVPVIR